MKNRSSRHPVAAKPVLSSLALAVLTTLIATGAQAAPVVEPKASLPISATTDILNITSSAQFAIGSPLSNTAPIDATITSGVVSNTVNGISSTSANTSSSVSDNTFAASATGNDFKNVAPLAGTANSIGFGFGFGFGTATLGVATNSGAISSNVNENAIRADQNLINGAIAVSGNTISANTIVNNGASTVAGSVPNNFQSGGAGASIDATTTISSADIVVTSSQTSSGLISGASASGNTVSLNLGSISAASAPAVDNNAISATFNGNSALNKIDIQAGGAPSIQGSGAVTNVQDLQAQGGASVNVSSIGATANGLAGSLSLQGNAISAAATGNKSGNTIALGDATSGVSFSGNSIAAASVAPGLVSGDLVISNAQNNGAGTAGASQLSRITADVVQLDSSLALSGNSIAASALGNTASSSLASGSGAASFAGTAALANSQTNAAGVNIVASSFLNEITSNTDSANNSAVSVEKNTIGITAQGNQASQNLALDATAFTVGSAPVRLTSIAGTITPPIVAPSISASGAAIVASTQSNVEAAVSATSNVVVVGAESGVTGVTATGVTVAVNLNSQNAVALGNSVDNALTLKGTSVSSNAGIANLQSNDGDSSVSAALGDAAVFSVQAGNVSAGAVSVTNNRQVTVASGNTAGNALSVSANTLAVAQSTDGAASAAGEVSATYGVLNVQSSAAGVRASTSAAASLGLGFGGLVAAGTISNVVAGNATNSRVKTEGNIVAATATGNEGVNSASISATSITGETFGAAANVTSIQDASGATIATAVTNGIGSTIGANVTGSTVTASANTIQARATGNAGSNTLDVTAGNVSLSGGAVAALDFGGNAGVNFSGLVGGAFTIQNTQTSTGTVTATQLKDGVPSEVRIDVAGSAANSTLTANDNLLRAAGTGNSAVNALTLGANALTAGSAVQNIQASNGAVNVLIGAPGTPGTPGTPTQMVTSVGYSTFGSNTSSSYSPTTKALTVNAGQTVIVSLSSYRAEVGKYLTALGFVVADGLATASGGLSGKTFDLSLFGNVDQSTMSGQVAYTLGMLALPAVPAVPGVPATAAKPNSGGVTLSVKGETITGSTLAVNGNRSSGTATGNSASNSIAVTANVAGTSVNDLNGGLVGTFGAAADNVLSNVQTTGPIFGQISVSNPISSTVYGTFAIDAPGATVSNSTLTVSGNSQSAFAVGSTAVNALSVAATSVPATSALQSVQFGDAAVSAKSDLQLSAPASANAASVALSNNRNVALAVNNDVTNTLTVSGTSVGSINAPAVVAEQLLSNMQQTGGDGTLVTSTAITRLQNQDSLAPATGIVNSTLAFSGNVTQAEASANRALNTATVTGASSQAAGVALNNSQFSYATVASNATVFASLLVNGGTSAALNNGSVAIDGNVTTALARGNAATNVLNSVAGSNYGIVSGAALVSPTSLMNPFVGSSSIVNADAGISNSQSNSGTVTATSSNAINQVALNSGALLGTIGTVGVTGNTVSADAFGNSATNRLTVSALNTGSPVAAIGSTQSNSGAVTALVTGANFGINLTGTVNNSTLRANGNQVTATAVGNSAASTIIATR